MKTNNKCGCPLDGSWSVKFCNIWSTHRQNDSFQTCQYQFECNRMKYELEHNKNESIGITKRILHLGIPQAL